MWPLEILLLLVAQLCPTFMLPMDCGPSGSSVRGISQARILEWVAISFSRGSSRPRAQGEDKPQPEDPFPPPWLAPGLSAKEMTAEVIRAGVLARPGKRQWGG